MLNSNSYTFYSKFSDKKDSSVNYNVQATSTISRLLTFSSTLVFQHDRDFSCESTQLPSHRLEPKPGKRDAPPALPWACPARQGRPGRQRRLNIITICFWPTPAPESIFAHFLKKKKQNRSSVTTVTLGNNGQCPLMCLSFSTCSPFLSPNVCCTALLHALLHGNVPGTGHAS